MIRTTVFKTSRGQSVLLPGSVAFPDHVREVEVIKVGKTRVVSPVGHRWDEFFEHGARATTDFMPDRIQPKADKRHKL